MRAEFNLEFQLSENHNDRSTDSRTRGRISNVQPGTFGPTAPRNWVMSVGRRIPGHALSRGRNLALE